MNEGMDYGWAIPHAAFLEKDIGGSIGHIGAEERLQHVLINQVGQRRRCVGCLLKTKKGL